RGAGAPPGAINWMTTVTLEGTQELMKQRAVAVILATGGLGLVRAAYSAGKPAYCVGPGNAPADRRRTADPQTPARDAATGTTARARRSITVCCAHQKTRSSWTKRLLKPSSVNFRLRAATSCRKPRWRPSLAF